MVLELVVGPVSFVSPSLLSRDRVVVLLGLQVRESVEKSHIPHRLNIKFDMASYTYLGHPHNSLSFKVGNYMPSELLIDTLVTMRKEQHWNLEKPN